MKGENIPPETAVVIRWKKKQFAVFVDIISKGSI